MGRGSPPAGLALVCGVLLLIWLPVQAPGPSLGAHPAVGWLYLRDGRLPAPGEELVQVLAVGDVMPGRGVAAGEGHEDPLAAVAPWLRAADLALGNLECVLGAGEGSGGRPPSSAAGQPVRLHAPASAAAMLAGAGFDLLGLANNHTLDGGPGGLSATAALLEQAGIEPVGAGPGPEAAFRPVVRRVRGLRLAFLAFNAVPGPDPLPAGDVWAPAAWDAATEGRVIAAVAAARVQADAVIVMLHWGYEYDRRSDPGQRAMARALLEAGADLVVGHHPHVPQEMESWSAAQQAAAPEAGRQGLVAYSLGNLLFDQEQGEARHGLALRAYFDRQGLRAVQALPLRAGPRPRPAQPAALSPLPAQGGQASSPDTGSSPPGRLQQMAASAGRTGPGVGPADAGAIDLTGDGVPEEVRLAGEQVVVYEDGIEAWRGLPQWRVVDLALGDPNDDGRAEVVLALWKDDAQGIARCHPFVVGHRGGSYRVLWGGSALPRPIARLELADLDGDGVQELLVLEEAAASGTADGQRTVAAWRWHGWGFSLLWRSAPGAFESLALLPWAGGAPERGP